MALHFDGNQFEQAFKPHCLRNWEVPKWYPQYPAVNTGCTRIISNDKGHLLPGVPRPQTNPWGDFVGTWDLPKKIDRKTANELSAPKASKVAAWKKRCERNQRLQLEFTKKSDEPVKGKDRDILSDDDDLQENVKYEPPPCNEDAEDKAQPCPIHDL